MKPLLLLGGAALLAWYFLSKNAGSLGYSIGTSSGGTAPGTTGGSTGGSTGGTSSGTPSLLAAVYASLVAAASAHTNGLTRDQWNYYPNQLPAVQAWGGMPAPGDVWGPVETGSYDPNQLISLSEYWSKMLPFLQGKGMSGLSGLGVAHPYAWGWAV